MENYKIEEIESDVILLKDKLVKFKIELEHQGRTDKNYNHLGTLDVNCKVLRSQLNRLIDVLDY